MITTFSVDHFVQRVQAAKNLLLKIEAISQEKSISEADVFAYRFTRDMYNLAEQVGSVVNQVRILSVYDGAEFIPFEFEYITGFKKSQEALDQALSMLGQFSPDAFDNLDNRTINISFLPPEGMPANLFLTAAIANLEFHITTMYDLARANGFPLNKGDFLNMYE